MNEPLEQLARFSFDWAETLCAPEHGCTHYHRMWSMIRLLESNGAQPAGAEFFGRELQPLGGSCRILISGAADTGLAAMILGQLRPRGIVPDFVLVDRCETTLAQNRLFARAAGIAMEVHHDDIRGCSCEPVQAVVAHSFLNFFPREERQKVVDSWARNLEPGGRLLLSQRLPEGRDRPTKARTGDEIKHRLSAIEQAAVSAGFAPPLIAELLESAEELWARPLSEDRATYSDLVDMLDRSKFRIVGTTKDDAGQNVSPIATADYFGTVPRCEIVAVKLP
jgi:hypothetical protein